MRAARNRHSWIWPGLVGLSFVVLLAVHRAYSGVGVFEVGLATLGTLIAALGSAIRSHQPGNRISRLLHATSVVIVLAAATSLVAESGHPPFSNDLWNYLAVVIYNTIVEVALYPILLILFIFPNGQFLTRKWAWAGWLAGVTTVAMLLVAAFSEEVGKIWDPNNEYWNLDNPIGFLPSGTDQFMASQAVIVMIILGLGGVVAMIIRYKRAALLVRQQIKWVAYAAGVAAIALLLATMSSSEVMWEFMPMTALAAIPIAITIAITKFKLFEIDRLVSRSVTYAVVVGLLAVVFAALTWLPSFVIGGAGDNETGASAPPIVVAASTLAVAALFNPLRKRIQRFVDRRFNRTAYEAQVVADTFAAKLQQSHTVQELGQALVQTADESLQPTAAGIWINQADE